MVAHAKCIELAASTLSAASVASLNNQMTQRGEDAYGIKAMALTEQPTGSKVGGR